MPYYTATFCFLFAVIVSWVAAESTSLTDDDQLFETLAADHFFEKRGIPRTRSVLAKENLDSGMPGVLRFGKRALENEKKSVPGVLRFGKRDPMPGVLRFGKRGDMPGVLRFGKREPMPGVLRFGKRGDMPGVLRFGKRSYDEYEEIPGILLKKSVPGVLRFGRK